MLLRRITPKVHIMQHIVEQSRVINSRYVQNYLEENLIDKVTDVWERSVSGPYKDKVQKHVCVKIVTGYILRFGL